MIRNVDGIAPDNQVLLAAVGVVVVDDLTLVYKLTIDTQGRLTTELLSTASLPETVRSRHTHTATVVDSIKALVARETSQVICHSDFPIRILDDTGRQAVRFSETNAGDLVCDAFRAT